MPRPRVSIANYRFKLRNGPRGKRAQRVLSGGTPREGARSTPKRGSPRGVGSEVRAQQRLAAGGGLPRSAARRAEWAAPLTRTR